MPWRICWSARRQPADFNKPWCTIWATFIEFRPPTQITPTAKNVFLVQIHQGINNNDRVASPSPSYNIEACRPGRSLDQEEI